MKLILNVAMAGKEKTMWSFQIKLEEDSVRVPLDFTDPCIEALIKDLFKVLKAAVVMKRPWEANVLMDEEVAYTIDSARALRMAAASLN